MWSCSLPVFSGSSHSSAELLRFSLQLITRHCFAFLMCYQNLITVYFFHLLKVTSSMGTSMEWLVLYLKYAPHVVGIKNDILGLS